MWKEFRLSGAHLRDLLPELAIALPSLTFGNACSALHLHY